MNCWQKLGIEPTNDKRAIKRAYAQQLKQNNPETNPEGFQQLRDAYDQALELAEQVELVEQTASDAETAESKTLPELHLSLNLTKTGYQFRSPGNRPQEPQANEKNRVEHQQQQEIEGVLQQLMTLLSKGETEPAIDYLQQRLTEGFFQALDVRYELEGQLLQRLVQQQWFNMPFSRFLAQHFQWQIDIDNEHNMIGHHFDQDSPYRRPFHLYCSRYLSELIREKIRYCIKQISTDSEFKRYLEFELLLFQDTPNDKLLAFCRNESNRVLVKAVHKYLALYNFNNRSVEGLPFNRLNILMAKGLYSNAQPAAVFKQAEEPRLRKAFGIIFLILTFAIIINNNINSHQPSQSNKDYLQQYAQILSDAGIKANLDKTILEHKASQGNAQSQYRLGLTLLYGPQPDYTLGLTWLQRAAEQNVPDAKRILGLFYLYGDFVSKDTQQGQTLLQEAIGLGSSKAARQLALEYLSGIHITENDQAAFLLFDEISNKSGYDLLWLSKLYRDGIGVMQNQAEANKFAEAAMAQASAADINKFAWDLSVNSAAALTDGERAVQLMKPLLTKHEQHNWELTDTLAAAFARMGDYNAAVETQQRAIEQMPADVSAVQKALMQKRLSSYRAHKPYVERLNNVSLADVQPSNLLMGYAARKNETAVE